jgi:hypothetical protein
MTWTLAFYETPRGERPAAAFVEQLPAPARADIVALLVALRARGNQLQPLGDGRFELRSVKHGVRVFYTFQPEHRIVLLDGMVKKRDDIPPPMLRRLRTLQADVAATGQEGRR